VNTKQIILLGFIALCATPILCQTSVKSDRDKAELLGPVAKTKTESTIFKRDRDKWVQDSERTLWNETEYDKLGKIVAQKNIPQFGDPAFCRYEYKYDGKNRQTERFCAGAPEKILERYTYENDRFGNWTRRVASVPDGDGFRPKWVLIRTITYFD
jgi:hypothetical protein